MVTVAVVIRFMQALLRATVRGTDGLQLALKRTSALWRARMPGEAEEVLQVTVGVDEEEEDTVTSAAAGWGAAAIGMLRCVSGSGGRAAARVKMQNVIRTESSGFMVASALWCWRFICWSSIEMLSSQSDGERRRQYICIRGGIAGSTRDNPDRHILICGI